MDQNREGDHICYISNLQIKAHYPGWDIAKDLKTTFAEIHAAWMKRISGGCLLSRLPSDEAASSRQFGSQSPKKTSSRMA